MGVDGTGCSSSLAPITVDGSVRLSSYLSSTLCGPDSAQFGPTDPAHYDAWPRFGPPALDRQQVGVIRARGAGSGGTNPQVRQREVMM